MSKSKQKDFANLMETRCTTYEFSQKPVPDSDITKILGLGRLAPSANNSQPWSFVVVKNKEKISSLMRLCHYGGFHTEPSVLIAIICEPVGKHQIALTRGPVASMTEYHQMLNIGVVATTLDYAATYYGFDAALLSPEIDAANRILSVKKGSKAILLLAIGHHSEGAFRKEKERKALSGMVHWEK